MKKKPLVSIAIVTYNQKTYLKECIESCLLQDYESIEIIVADDCSTDGSQELLQYYNELYPGKFVLKLGNKNRGITHNSNEAHFACRGKYIAWMGGDDLMLPGKIKKQVAYMEANNNCAICYHNLDVFDSNSGDTIREFNKTNQFNGNIRTSIKYGAFNGACSTMVRRKMSPKYGFNEGLNTASDWFYWVETLQEGGTINYINEILGRYRRHNNNITNSDDKKLSDSLLDHLITCQYLLQRYPLYFNEIIYRYGTLLFRLRKYLNYKNAIITSFKLRPSYLSIFYLAIYYLSFKRIKK